jgi:aspartyl/asparaginyl beta-hydroxylase (cupin superfamily)
MDMITKILMNYYDSIKEEAMNIYSTKKLIDATRSFHESDNLLIYSENWVKGWTDSNGWINYSIFYADKWNDNLITSKILKKIEKNVGKKIIMAGFSMLKAGENIIPHQDEKWTHKEKNVYHLGLDVPDNCALHVSEIHNNEQIIMKYDEKDKKIINFDDGNIHFAINGSDKDRMILYIKFNEEFNEEFNEKS